MLQPGQVGQVEGAATAFAADTLTVHGLQAWIAAASAQLHEGCLLRMHGTLQREVKKIQIEKEEEVHFVRQIQSQLGGTKTRTLA